MHYTTVDLAGLFFVMPSHTGTEALAFILRWVHLVAAITWVGLLYFFNFVNVPFMKQVDAGMKPKIFQYMTMPALQLFRWSSMLTVFVGFWYWSQIYVAADAHRMGVKSDSLLRDFKDTERLRSGIGNHGGCDCRSLVVRELHSRGSGRQPRPLHRHWRRNGLHHALQRVGHYLAQ
jgi:hypothetical protein